MTENQAKRFFLEQVLDKALDLPLRDAQTFLKGLLLFTGEHDGIAPLRDAYDALYAAHERMEHLQTTLDLP